MKRNTVLTGSLPSATKNRSSEQQPEPKIRKTDCLTLLLAALALPAFAQQPTAAERAAMLKATWPPARLRSVNTSGSKPRSSASKERKNPAK